MNIRPLPGKVDDQSMCARAVVISAGHNQFGNPNYDIIGRKVYVGPIYLDKPESPHTQGVVKPHGRERRRCGRNVV